jgi:hypothetical protein
MGRVICIAAPFVFPGERRLSVQTSGAKLGQKQGGDYYHLRRIIPSGAIIQRQIVAVNTHEKAKGRFPPCRRRDGHSTMTGKESAGHAARQG